MIKKVELNNFIIPEKVTSLFPKKGSDEKEIVGIFFLDRKEMFLMKDKKDDEFLIFAKDDYENLFGVNTKEAKVYLLFNRDTSEKCGYQAELVNTSFENFCSFVHLCYSNDLIRKLYTEDEISDEEQNRIPIIAKQLRNRFKEIDSDALKDDESWWSVFIEELTYYGDDEEDFEIS